MAKFQGGTKRRTGSTTVCFLCRGNIRIGSSGTCPGVNSSSTNASCGDSNFSPMARNCLIPTRTTNDGAVALAHYAANAGLFVAGFIVMHRTTRRSAPTRPRLVI